MVSSLSHFSHAVSLKDKDGLCSEGLIDQNNCASICLLKAEQTTASQGLYFHQLSQPLMLLTWVVLIGCRTAWQAGNIQQSHAKASLSRKEHIYWCVRVKWMLQVCWRIARRNKTREICNLRTACCDQCKLILLPYSGLFSIRNHRGINCSFDEIQFTVIAAVLLQWHQWYDDRRPQLWCHLSIFHVLAYFY